MGQYTQVDPIGLVGGNPTLYGYVFDPLLEIDLFGLATYYELISNGEVIYRGMTRTNNRLFPRVIEHARGYGRTAQKTFDQVRYISDLSVVDARNLEGSALHHSRGNQNLLNKTRADGGFYHQYNPNKMADGRTFLGQSEIDNRMRNSTTENVDKRGNIRCPG